jgi:hypothetical protein
MDGSMCTTDDNPDPCSFGTTVCDCGGPPMGPEGTWSCGECPATEPMDGSACDSDVNSVDCDYGMNTCDCGGMDMWNCD